MTFCRWCRTRFSKLYVPVSKFWTTSQSVSLESLKCYIGKIADVGMYGTMFAAGLRLPLTTLHRLLANFLGLSISQIAPNTWRIFIRVEILWGRLSGGNRQLTLNEFFWCYRPQHIVLSQGIYHFSTRKKELRLVFDMPDSNRNWKGRYFFVKGMNWVCRQEEWETMPHGFDNTWAYVKDSGWPRLLFSVYLFQISNIACLSFLSASVRSHITGKQEDFIRKVTEILMDEWKCRDLITLNTLHAYCRGPEPTQEARRLNAYSGQKLLTLTLFLFPSAYIRPSFVLIILYLPFCRNGGS